MIESHLKEGNQPFPSPDGKLDPGISITDACISWEVTERLLLTGRDRLRAAVPVSAAA